MNARKLWVYLAVLLIVAGAFILSESVFLKKSKEKEAVPLFNLTPGGIQEIRWQRGEEVIELKKNKTWEIVRPITAAADTQVLEGVLQGLIQLKPERRFQPAGKDLAEFGLYPPQSMISFSAQGKRYEIRIGAKAAVGNALYLMVAGSPEIYLAEAFALKELDRDLLALREKQVFSLTLEQIAVLELRNGQKNWQLKKTDKGWIEPGLPERLLSKSKVESFIIALTGAKAKAFLEGEKENPLWGLQGPSVRVALTGGGNQKIEETLLIGAEVPGQGFYARSSRYAPALVIDGALIGRIPRDLAEWRENPESKPSEPPKEDKKGS